MRPLACALLVLVAAALVMPSTVSAQSTFVELVGDEGRLFNNRDARAHVGREIVAEMDLFSQLIAPISPEEDAAVRRGNAAIRAAIGADEKAAVGRQTRDE